MKNLKKFLPFISIGAIAVAIIMFFLPFVDYKATILGVTTESHYNGFQYAFGAVVKSTSLGDISLKVLAVDLIAFIMLVLAVIGWAVNFVVKTKFVKIIRLCVACLAIVAAILLFFTVANFFGVYEVDGNVTKYYTIGAGAVIGGILGLVGGASEVAQVVLK